MEPTAKVVVLDQVPEATKAPAVGKPPAAAGVQSWKWLLLSTIAALVIIGVGLGVGLGLGLKGRKDAASNDQDDPFAQYANLPTRYIAAEKVTWDYGGSGGGKNLCRDPTLFQNVTGLDNPKHSVPLDGLGGAFIKAVYREYTDATFTTLKEQPKYMGLFGTLLHAEAGSQMRIIFRNKLGFAVNMEPISDITWSLPKAGPLPIVIPGETATLVWQVPEEMFANTSKVEAGYQSSKLVLFHSTVNPTKHDSAGLVGGVIVTAKGQANADGTTKGVDKDVVTLWMAHEEQTSPFAFENAKNPGLQNKSYVKMAINGYTWCSLPDLNLTAGQKVRWHVASIGGATNVHSVHWHGNTLLHHGKRVDHVDLVGVQTASLDMVPDAPGNWLMHCHLNAHLDQGMVGLYSVSGAAPSLQPEAGGVVRTYYIAAEEMIWDFTPTGGEVCSGKVQNFSEAAAVFLGEPEGIRVGSKYLKAVYREYTDDTFTKQVNRTASQQYLGMLGPIIRANVGDVIKVVFRNKARFAFNVHPHGVLYDKTGEGAPYADGNTSHGDDVVQPNTTYKYTWAVPERAGPGPSDPSSIMWMYHSHVDESLDTSAGLVGVIIISKGAKAPQGARPNELKPADVDEEAVLIYTVLDEALSRYAVLNVKSNLNSSLWGTEEELTELFEQEDFGESSLKHMINGFMFCNMPNLTFTAGKRVRLHIMSLGSQEDMHSAAIQGGMFADLGIHRAATAILAGTMMSMDVVFTEPDTYKLTCRVNDHVMAGMINTYTVLPAPAGPLAIAGGTVKTYYIAADPVVWNYAPKGYVQCTTQDLKSVADPYVRKGFYWVGPIRTKALYRAYTDDKFTTVKPQDSYLGLLGPLVAAEVGDVIQVVFKNNVNFTVNFSPDGGLVALHAAGGGKEVAPGETFTYKWVVPQQAGPLQGDVSTVAVPYMSDVDMPADTSSGLMGVMLLGNKGSFKADGITPTDADSLLVFMFNVFNEEMSHFHQVNLDNNFTPAEQKDLTASTTFSATNQFYSINGYVYCNMDPPQVTAGSRVRVVLLGFGSEEAVHSPHILGQPIIRQVTLPDETTKLLPSVTGVADIRASNPGLWPITCDVTSHQANGMVAQLQVTSPAKLRRML